MYNRYLLWLRFDGSLFNGFAKAGGTGYGVIDFLLPALERVLFPRDVGKFNVFPCSRTDRDVHVLRAPVVLNIPKVAARLDNDKINILKDLNDVCQTFYPNSIEASDLHWVSPGFSARKHVVYRLRVAREMEWYSQFERVPSLACFSERFHSWTIPPGFDFNRANSACKLLLGSQNVASFLKEPLRYRDPNVPRQSVVKYIDLVRVVSGDTITGIEDPHYDYFNFEIVSKSFVREQIRRMVRILVKCGYNERFFDDLRIMLRYPDPQTFIRLGHRAANGKGLYLSDVVFDRDSFENPVPYYYHPIDEMG